MVIFILHLWQQMSVRRPWCIAIVRHYGLILSTYVARNYNFFWNFIVFLYYVELYSMARRTRYFYVFIKKYVDTYRKNLLYRSQPKYWTDFGFISIRPIWKYIPQRRSSFLNRLKMRWVCHFHHKLFLLPVSINCSGELSTNFPVVIIELCVKFSYHQSNSDKSVQLQRSGNPEYNINQLI